MSRSVRSLREYARPQRLAVVVLAVLLALLAGGCAGGSAGNTSNTITLGLPVEATTLAPVYLADDTNLWAQHGLTVKVVTFKGDAELAKAVLSGDVDVALGSLVGPLTVNAAGQQAKVFYGGFDMPAFTWYATKDIHSVKQAKGKTWGVTTLGSSTDLLTRYALAQSGLDPKKDAKIVQGGASAARLAAMKAGQLQVNIFTQPQTISAQKAGYNKILDLKDIVDTYPMHVAWSTPKFLAKHTVAKEFIAGLSAGMKLTKAQPDEAAQSIATTNKIPLGDAKASLAQWIDQLYPDGRMPDATAMDAFWNMGIDGGVFKKRIPDSQWLDTEFLPKTAGSTPSGSQSPAAGS
jgi:NitT/TauT family transport system substrate-binding protein